MKLTAVILAILIFVPSVLSAETPPASSQWTAEQYRHAKLELETLYGPRLKGRSKEESLPVARRMLADATLTHDEALRYLLTQRAMQVLAAGGDIPGAITALNSVRRMYPENLGALELTLVTSPGIRGELDAETTATIGKVCLSLIERTTGGGEKGLDLFDRKRLLAASASIASRTENLAVRVPLNEHLRRLASGLLRQSGQDVWQTIAFIPQHQLSTQPEHWAGAIQRWIIEDGRQLRINPDDANAGALLILHSRAPSCLGVLADGGLWVWNVSRKEFVAQLDQSVRVVACSPDGTMGASSGNTVIRLWNIETRQEVLQLKGHTGAVTSFVFSFDGRRLLSGAADKTVRLWDLTTGKELLVLVKHEAPIGSVALSADGRWALSGGDDKQIYLWDLDTGRHIRTFSLHQAPVVSVCFSGELDQAISSSRDGTFLVWDLNTGNVLAGARIDWSEVGKNLLTVIEGATPPAGGNKRP